MSVIRKKYPNVSIYLILDNYSIHKTKKVEEFLAIDCHMGLVFLPRYSPELDRMEDIWRTFHSHIIKNILHPSLEALLETTERYFEPMVPLSSIEGIFTQKRTQDLVEIT